MTGSNQDQELKRILASLTPDKASVLAAKLERQKLEGKGGPQIDAVLAILRNQLRSETAFRWPTPQQLFCAAFEDFLANARAVKLPGRIARTSIDPVWAWLMDSALPEQGPDLVKHIAKATLDRNEPLKTKLTEVLQHEAAKAIAAAVTAAPRGSQGAARLAAVLGGDDVLEDMREMGLLLAHPAALTPFRALVPQGFADLTDGTIVAFRQLYDQCVQDAPELGAYTVILAMNRLARPWEAMALVRAVSRQSQDRLLTETDMGFAGELLIADLETLAAEAAAMRPETFDAQTLARVLERMAAASAGMARELSIKRDGKWGARIQKARALAANGTHALLGRAAREVLAAFPAMRVGVFAKGPRKPDLSHAPDPARVATALRWTELMAAVRPASQGLGYQSSLQAAYDEIEGVLRQHAEAVLSEMRTAADAEIRSIGAAFIEAQAQIAANLFGQEAASLLRRRAAAAAAA
jgi:hypothetical protein